MHNMLENPFNSGHKIPSDTATRILMNGIQATAGRRRRILLRWKPNAPPRWAFPKVPDLGVLITRILLFRVPVLY